nr:MAG TPA: hypothetical protein [Caudoviricetes sp.]
MFVAVRVAGGFFYALARRARPVLPHSADDLHPCVGVSWD